MARGGPHHIAHPARNLVPRFQPSLDVSRDASAAGPPPHFILPPGGSSLSEGRAVPSFTPSPESRSSIPTLPRSRRVQSNHPLPSLDMSRDASAAGPPSFTLPPGGLRLSEGRAASSFTPSPESRPSIPTLPRSRRVKSNRPSPPTSTLSVENRSQQPLASKLTICHAAADRSGLAKLANRVKSVENPTFR